MRRTTIQNENQVKRGVYGQIILFFLVFLLVFLLLANLVWVVPQYNSGKLERAQQQRTQAVFDRLSVGNGAPDDAVNVSVRETCAGCEVNLLGSDERLMRHLDMLGQPWQQIEAKGTVSGLIVVADPQPDAETMVWLMKQNDAGAHLLFLHMPPADDTEMLDRLGIAAAGGYETFPGMRTGKEMMLGDILEYDGGEEEGPLQIEAYDVKLSQQTKVFAHALTEDHLEREVHELPPLFWRYAPGDGKGYVYVCNGNSFDSEIAYALLPTVFGDIKGSFIYPIVNAYCTMIDGFPYAENAERDLWEELYSRDGYGIQRELLLPEWERIHTAYGAALTCFSPAYGKIQSRADREMCFYSNEFERGIGELAGKSDAGYYFYSPDEPVRVVPMDSGFLFEDDDELRIPYLDGDWVSIPRSLFRFAGTARGLGYVGMRIDVESLLQIKEKEGLPEFFNQMESLLGYQEALYPWMERTTAQEAAERIDTYMSLQPVYTYQENGVTVRVDSLNNRDAWFLLRTCGKDPTTDSGTIEEIGENMYLVKITGQVTNITWNGSDGK